MVEILNAVSIRARLLAIVILAGLAVLVLGLGRVNEADARIIDADRTLQGVAFARTASALVHELQKERGNSAGYIGSKAGAAFKTNLDKQRAATEPKLREFMQVVTLDAVPESLRARVSSARSSLNQIAQMRGRVTSLSATVPEMAKYYTGTIGQLLGLFSAVTGSASDRGVVERGSALSMLLEAKERAGIERAMGANGFGAGKFAPAIAARFNSLIAQQQAFVYGFNRFATKDQQAKLSDILASSASREVGRLRQIARDSFITGDTQGVKGTDWFAKITSKINELYGLEKILDEQLQAYVEGERSAALKAYNDTLVFLIVLLVVLVTIALVLAYSLSQPMDRLMRITELIAAGEYDTEIPYQSVRSEIGCFARNMQNFRDSLQETEELRRQREEEERRLAQERTDREYKARQKELKERVQAQKVASDQQKLITDGLKQLSDVVETELAGMIEDVLQTARSTASNGAGLLDFTSKVNENMNNVRDAAGNATSNANSVASAAEELNASISEITSQVEASQQLITSAADESTAAGNQLEGLTAAADKIASVVTIIGDIAEQTNLLALNATIEAARAGEAGKGFAVVASEVKSLANQTAASLNEIQQYVQKMQGEVGETVKQIQKIGSSMEQVNARSAAVASAVIEQSATTQEISRAIQTASESVSGVSTKVDSVQQETSQLVGVGENIASSTNKIEESIKRVQARLQDVVEETRRNSDRRIHDRREIEPEPADASITTEFDELKVQLVDYSLSGVGLKFFEPTLEVIQDATVVFRLESMSADARIVWVNEEGCGLNFLDPTQTESIFDRLQQLTNEMPDLKMVAG